MKKPELYILGIDGGMPSMIKKGVAEGKLPGFKRLMDSGVFFNDMMPAFPSITPTCWAAISCGAVAKVTGALSDNVHVEGVHPLEYITPYNSAHIKAERFWESAARIGKTSLILDIPTSGPAKSDKVIQVRGGITISAGKSPERSAIFDIPKQQFTSDTEPFIVDYVKVRAGGGIEEIQSKNDFECKDGKVYIFKAIFADARFADDEVEPHTWCIIREKNGVRFGADKEDALSRPVILQSGWSDVVTRRLKTKDGEVVPFHFRARLDKFDEETGYFSVYVSNGVNVYKEVTPKSVAKEIAEIPEIRTPDWSALVSGELDRFMDGVGFKMEHCRKTMQLCMEKYGPDIIFDYEGETDSYNHSYRSAYEGFEKYEGHQKKAIEYYDKLYKMIDDHLLWVLDNIVDENTTIAVVSDHGACGYHPDGLLNTWNVLTDEGLMSATSDVWCITWDSKIDWTKTKAYPVGACYVNVNLKGREPTGIVEPEDYEKVKHEILEALYKNARHPKSEEFVLAFAVDGNQAGFMGHGGENCGDIVYGYAGADIGGYIGGIHSQQIPSAKSKTGDIRCIGMMCGPKFKKGVCLDRPADLTDFAPTLCYALGYPQPKDATGGVVFAAFDDEK